MTKKQSTWKKTKRAAYSNYAVYLIFVGIMVGGIFYSSLEKGRVSPSPVVSAPGVATDIPVEVKSKDGETIFGYSAAGKPINGFVLGDGADTTLMFGSIHGNEMGTADLMNHLVTYLQENPSAVAAGKRVVIIPILNPDGYYDRMDKLNADEVNLNLNFATSDWALFGGENGDYAGAEPWSEPESKVLKAVVEKYLPNRMLSYHSNGSLVNPEYLESSQELAWWYAVESGYYYYADPAWDFTGTATKWFEETYGKPAVTVELNDHYLSDWEMNQKPMLELLN